MGNTHVRHFHLLLGALLVTGMGVDSAQAQQVTTADYQRAASMLGDRAAPLVDNAVSDGKWLDDDSLVYALANGGKTTYLRLDPRTGKSVPAFEMRALADAINQANPNAKPADPDKLRVSGIKRDREACSSVRVQATTAAKAAAASGFPRPRPAMNQATHHPTAVAKGSSAKATCGCAKSPAARKPS